MATIIVSGGFDPVHVGHLRMFNESAALGDALIVIANNDNWLRQKKGYAFMPENERKEIIEGFESVTQCVLTTHEPHCTDMSVCEALRMLREQYPEEDLVFANGGDRKADNVPEYVLCEQLGIRMVFGVGGGKVQSSSDLTKAARAHLESPVPAKA